VKICSGPWTAWDYAQKLSSTRRYSRYLKARVLIVIYKGDTDVDLKDLRRRIGAARLSFGRPELLLEVLGVMPGSVTAFAVLNDVDHQVKVIFDQDLMRFDSVNCHPLENNATTNIARDYLLGFIRATGHEPMIVDLKKSQSS